MYTRSERVNCDPRQLISYPFKTSFEISDRILFQTYLNRYSPRSCEYNFSNLFSWFDTYPYSWCLYKERILIYDVTNACTLMPLGKELSPEELVGLSTYLIDSGLNPDIALVPKQYIDAHPEIEHFYAVEEERDFAEYIYLTGKLYTLTGVKLHKKKNLISQFKRRYPESHTRAMNPSDMKAVCDFVLNLMEKQGQPSNALENEYKAIVKAFEHFDNLEMEGLVLMVEDQMIAFSMFSRLTPSCYNIQFEKSDFSFKGAAQMINWETAGALKGKCRYLNREQDLGIRGLRQAKLSYDPETLLTHCFLKFC